MGMGLGPIPLSEIKAYIELFSTDDIELFVYLIHEIDRTYLDFKK